SRALPASPALSVRASTRATVRALQGESGVGTQLHDGRQDPGLNGRPRRLSTPKLPDGDQIGLVRAIHGADSPAKGFRAAGPSGPWRSAQAWIHAASDAGTFAHERRSGEKKVRRAAV